MLNDYEKFKRLNDLFYGKQQQQDSKLKDFEQGLKMISGTDKEQDTGK